MKNVKKFEWLELTDTSLPAIDYLQLKYKKCNWYIDSRESFMKKYLLEKDNKKKDRFSKLFSFL